MNITTIDDGALEFQDGTNKYLGFPTGISPRKFSHADTVDLKGTDGIIIDSRGRVSSWPISRFIEHAETMVALGPWINDTRVFQSRPLSPEVLRALLPAIRALGTVGYPIGGLFTRAFRWLPDGGLMVYPPKLAAWVRKISPSQEQGWEKWIHPDITGEASWCFTLGVLAWHILTNADPFANETGEERRERIRLGVLPPLAVLVPGIETQGADIIQRSLVPQGEAGPSLKDWNHMIDRWIQNGLVTPLTDLKQEALGVQAARQAENVERRLMLRRRFRKSGWKILSIAAITAVLLIFTSVQLKRALEPPITQGMEPIEVAEVYYNAINALDSKVMDDCLGRRIGREDQRQVDMIFVNHRVRQGYEGLGELPRASEWIQAGRPDLPAGLYPWGITGLKLKRLDDRRIEARYVLWAPWDETAVRTHQGVSRVDVLTFTETRRNWEITKIERTSVE